MSLLDLLSGLEQALVAETGALRTRDIEALDLAVGSKRRILAELAQVRAARGEGEASRAGPGDAELLALLRRCRELNDTAGSAIAVLRQHTESTLGFLGVEREPPGYGASGRRTHTGRDLAVC